MAFPNFDLSNKNKRKKERRKNKPSKAKKNPDDDEEQTIGQETTKGADTETYD